MPDSKQFKKYMIFCFSISWLLQGIASYFAWQGSTLIFQGVVSVSMFVPLLSVYLSGYPLSSIGWSPSIKGNVKKYLVAWFVPALLTMLGAAVFFLIFPRFFDTSGAYISAQAGVDVMEQLASQGVSFTMYILISVISSITYAPLFNMFLAVGEEAGWRGFLYPYLKSKYGIKKGRILGGIIWGIWHWPLIGLAGYEYGMNYIGFPITGMLTFCIITISFGILCDWFYDNTKSIWAPALCHGAINASAALGLMYCATDIGSYILLGPAAVGIIGGIGFILAAIWITIKS